MAALALSSESRAHTTATKLSFRQVSAPVGGRATRVDIFQETVDDLLATLKHDEDAPRIGLQLTPGEVLALRHLLKAQIDALVDKRAKQDTHFGHINLMAADDVPPIGSAHRAKTTKPNQHHTHKPARRSSLTADVTRRRRRRMNTFMRFDGLEELKRQKSRVTTDLDSSAIQGVFALFEDHNLWRKRLHGIQFFRDAVRKVIHINRARKHATARRPSGDDRDGGNDVGVKNGSHVGTAFTGVAGANGATISRSAAQGPTSTADPDAARHSAAAPLSSADSQELKFEPSISKPKDLSQRASKSLQKEIFKLQRYDLIWKPSADVIAALASVNHWGEFDIWNLHKHVPGTQSGQAMGSKSRGTVKILAIELLEKRTRLLSHMHVSPPGVLKFLDRVCDTYVNNPYHNALHGADVMQGLHTMLVTSGITRAFEQAGVSRSNSSNPDSGRSGHTLSLKNHFAALLAALCHDIGHPGYTNRFLVRTSDSIATQYNDQSVLENMHVATALSLARECLIFSSFTNDERRTVRHLMIEMILETDMAKHISSLWKLEHDLEAARTTALMESDQPVANGSLSVENDHDLHPKSRASVISLTQHHYDGFSMKNYVNTLSLMLHACDLSNPAKPWKTYRTWTDRVMEEFFAQSAKETELKIPITLPLEETCSLDQFQIGFIRFIKPFFAALGQIPGLDLSEQMENLNANEKKWMELRGSGVSFETGEKNSKECVPPEEDDVSQAHQSVKRADN